MLSITLRLACVAALAAVLSGCVMYVAPDHHTWRHTPPATDEKPATTVNKT